jgi:hypothetical protein
MNWKPLRGSAAVAWSQITTRLLLAWLFILAMCFGLQPALMAQDSPTIASTNSAAGTPAEQIAAQRLELTNAWQQVIRIVNQPVKAYVRSDNTPAAVYSPGWFHEGASTPDFDTVDVRQTRELIYASHPYVTSDLNPGLVFLGQDLEFNSMTKLFYVDRSLPKHKLTEAQMLEINRLYRIIGHCRREIARLEAPTETEAAASAQNGAETGPAAPSGFVGRIQSIPREKRALYGGIAIGALVVIVVVLRLARRESE